MKNSKIGSAVYDFLTAYCIGHCRLFGTMPFATAILGAGCAYGRNPWTSAAGLVCALLEIGGITDRQMLVYPVLWGLVIALVRNRRLQVLYPRSFCLSLLTGVTTAGILIPSGLFLHTDIQTAYRAAESVLVFSLMTAYCFAYRSLQEDRLGFLEDTQTLLAVLILATSVLCGMPIQLFGLIELLSTVCLVSVFCVSYRFGVAAGVSWAAISGAVYALRIGDMSVLAAWIFLTVMTFVVSGVFHAGRYISLCIFDGVYVLLGCTAFPVLIEEDGIKAVAAASLLLFLVPGTFLTQVRAKALTDMQDGAEWGHFVLTRIQKFSAAMKRIDYTFAGAQGQQIGFGQIGELLDDFTKQLDVCVPMRADAESRILEKLGSCGVQVKSMTLLKAPNGQYRLYADACVGRGRLVGAETVKNIINKETGIAFEIGADSRQTVGRRYDLVVLEQKPAFRIVTAARRLACQADVISGDNFFIGQTRHGQALVMIADGMGSGNRAAADSEELLSAVEELVETGFAQEFAVKLVNAYLSRRNRGEHFATLDMLLLDLYTGVGHLMKYGAATTYICRGKWMEIIKSTSLPVGIVEDAGCECSSKKYYADDLVVMVSDGVLDSILFENKDDYMHTLLANLAAEDPDTIADAIVADIRSVCGRRLKDDATLIVCRVVRNI